MSIIKTQKGFSKVATLVLIGVALSAISYYWGSSTNEINDLKARFVPDGILQAPGIIIVEPVNGVILPKKGPVTITAKSSSKNIIIIEPVNGILSSKRCEKSNVCEYSLNMDNLPSGSYVFTAIAIDALGNVGSAKTTFIKQ